MLLKELQRTVSGIGQYYPEWDEKTETWSVFHTAKRPGHAFGKYSSRQEAKDKADEMNKH